jgi:hypothetical protein
LSRLRLVHASFTGRPQRLPNATCTGAVRCTVRIRWGSRPCCPPHLSCGFSAALRSRFSAALRIISVGRAAYPSAHLLGPGWRAHAPTLVDRCARSFSLCLPSFAAAFVGRRVGPRATQRAEGHVRPPASLETAQVVASPLQRATLVPVRPRPLWGGRPLLPAAGASAAPGLLRYIFPFRPLVPRIFFPFIYN